MMAIALLLRPWILAKRNAYTVPRALVDDLLLVGLRHQEGDEDELLATFLAGIHHTLDFVAEMGGGGRYLSANAYSWPHMASIALRSGCTLGRRTREWLSSTTCVTSERISPLAEEEHLSLSRRGPGEPA